MTFMPAHRLARPARSLPTSRAALRKLGERRPSESSKSVKKILVGECKQEISSFNPLLGQYEDFTVHRGAQLFGLHRNMRSEMAGALADHEAYPFAFRLGCSRRRRLPPRISSFAESGISAPMTFATWEANVLPPTSLP